MIKVIDGTPVKLDYNPKEWSSKSKYSLFLCSFLNDTRNLPLAEFIVMCALTVIPSAILVYVFNSHIWGVIHLLVTYLMFFPKFMCFLHVYTHNKPLTRFPFADFIIIDVILSVLMGMPPFTYYIQHVLIHHHGGNAPGLDTSSTEHFQRDDIFCIFKYWCLRFSPPCLVWDLVSYCFARKRLLVLGISYLFGVFAVVFLPIPATAWIWLVFFPMWLTSLAGGWAGVAQHMFLNPKKPRKVFSFDIINSKANYNGFNEGFHHIHHSTHTFWRQLPQKFLDNFDDNIDDGVLVFDKYDNPEILWLAVTGQYEELARHMVGNRVISMNEAVKIIKDYLKPIKSL